MKNILVLGPHHSPLSDFLLNQGFNVQEHGEPLSLSFLKDNNFNMAISYRYRHIIKPQIITYLNGNIINLHISYLPWNRGADPNLWSFLEDTPKGVSVHYIDAGIDTGDIIFQEKVFIDEEKATLSSSYEALNEKVIELFQENFQHIFSNNAKRYKQEGHGSFHRLKDKEPYLHLLAEKGWNTLVKDIKGKALTQSKQSNGP